MGGWLVCLVGCGGRLVGGWLVGWLVGLLVGWLDGWEVGCGGGRLVGL